MTPKVFKDLLEACNACILSCQECYRAADSCSKNSAADKSCKDFVTMTKDCTATCEKCIKACDAMIAEFTYEKHPEHMEALNSCVKALGENIRKLNDTANKCSIDEGCHVAVLDAKDALNNAIAAVDACIESCEKHEVVYEHIKKY